MAIKELRLPSTGIYQRTDRSAALQCSAQTLSDLMRLRSLASNPQADPLPSFDEIEERVTEFLEQYLRQRAGLGDVDRRDAASAGIEYVANRRIESGREELEQKFRQRISQEEKRPLIRELTALERASDARDVLCHLRVMRSQLTIGETEQASFRALWLGIAFERFRIRISEPRAWTGDAIYRGASKGGFATKKGVRERYEQLASDFDGSGLSQRSFARTRGISPSTLKRALRGAKK